MSKSGGNSGCGCLTFIIIAAVIAYCVNDSSGGTRTENTSNVSSSVSSTTQTDGKINTQIVIDYESAFGGDNSPLSVYVDGTNIGEATTESRFIGNIDLEEGEHSIYLGEYRIKESDKIKFTVTQNRYKFYFNAKNRVFAGGYKFEMLTPEG